MGKYMRKTKTTADVAVMDLSLGVRTRAKTLALQRQARLHADSAAPPAPLPPSCAAGGGYLQLRSRRLPAIFIRHDSKRQKQGQTTQNSKLVSRARVGQTKQKAAEIQDVEDDDNNYISTESKDFGVEGSFGENILEVEARERSTRETTPSSLMRDPETIRTPGSTTRPANSTETNRRLQSSIHRHIPTSHEMDEFFAKAEEEQQRQFVEKYNFDPVVDKPLPGRYEWENCTGRRL